MDTHGNKAFESNAYKEEGLGVAPETVAGLSGSALRSGPAVIGGTSPTIPNAPEFGDVWTDGRGELVILRCVGDDLYLTADANGHRHYLNTVTGGYSPKP